MNYSRSQIRTLAEIAVLKARVAYLDYLKHETPKDISREDLQKLVDSAEQLQVELNWDDEENLIEW